MGAGLGVYALFREPEPFHRTPVDQVLLHDLRGVFGLDVAVPDRFGIHDDGGPVFALIEAAGFVDADRSSQARSLGKLLQLRVQFALAVRGA